jgi:hypothetical protein
MLASHLNQCAKFPSESPRFSRGLFSFGGRNIMKTDDTTNAQPQKISYSEIRHIEAVLETDEYAPTYWEFMKPQYLKVDADSIYC